MLTLLILLSGLVAHEDTNWVLAGLTRDKLGLDGEDRDNYEVGVKQYIELKLELSGHRDIPKCGVENWSKESQV